MAAVTGFRTPLRRVRGLGAAGSGVGGFLAERVTSVALIPLTLWAMWAAVRLASGDYPSGLAFFAAPLNAALAGMFIVVGAWHAQIGMRVIVEDYIAKRSTKTVLLLANLFLTWGVAALGLIAVLKLALGAGPEAG